MPRSRAVHTGLRRLPRCVDASRMMPDVVGGINAVLSAMVLQVNVKPGSRVEVLDRDAAGRWVARVQAPAAEGRANEALIALLAKHFDVHRRQVRIRTGHVSRIKLVEIDGLLPDQLRLFE